MAQVIRMGLWASLGPPAWLLLPPEGGILGRGTGCDVRLNDPAVSHHHAEVGLNGQGLFIRDLGSKHGLKLDGRRVREARITPEQTVRLAGYTLRFSVQDVEQALPEELERLLLRLYSQAAFESGLSLAKAWSRAVPKKAAAQRLLAWFLLSGDYSREAEEAVQRAAWLAPAHPGTWFAQGLLAEKQGDLGEAMAHINKVLEADPGHEPARKAHERLTRKQEVYSKVSGLVGARQGGSATAPLQEAQLSVAQFIFYFTAGLHDGLVSVAYAALAQAAEQINARLSTRPEEVRVVIKPELAQDGGLQAAARYTGMIELDAGHLAKGDPNFLFVALAHEYVHLVVDRVSGGSCPRWLDEGLAQFLTQNQTPKDRRILARARAQSALLPLEAIEGDFAALELPALVDLAYSQSYSLVEYLAEIMGDDGLGDLISELSAAGGLDRALAAYGLSLTGVESSWREWLN